jgi:hypothetical protein
MSVVTFTWKDTDFLFAAYIRIAGGRSGGLLAVALPGMWDRHPAWWDA